MATHIGERWGNYHLVRSLGQGGFAEVYLGEHVHLGMPAAIKILHSRLEGDAIVEFQREAQTIAELTHPHIIRVLDFDVQQGVPFLVLEYAPNGSLRQQYPRGQRVPLAQVGDAVQQIASALQFAHDRKIIHRDVKPENMLLNAQGQIVLTDFGIATLAHSTSSMHTQDTVGTLAYMAPEQIEGRPRPASDQYALAVTAYQWLTGILPFQGSSAELIAQHLTVAPPPLRQKAPDLPLEVEQAVLVALRKNSQERFGSVQAFAHALTTAGGLTPQMTFPLASANPTQPAEPTLGVIAPTTPVQASRATRATQLTPTLTSPGELITPEPPSLRRRNVQESGLSKLSLRSLSAIFVLMVLIGAALLSGITYVASRLSTAKTPTPSLIQTLSPTSPPLYAAGLKSTNPSIFLNSFSQALGYQNVPLIEGSTDTRHFLVSCNPSVMLSKQPGQSCTHNWKDTKNFLEKNSLQFYFPQNPQQQPPLAGACRPGAPPGAFYVLGQVDNKGGVLPIAHFVTSVFTFNCVTCGSESTWAWGSVYICGG